MKKIGFALLAVLVSMGAFAQGNAKQKWEKPSPEKVAEFRTNRMKDQLGLTDQQYKKVYEINLAEAKANEAKMAEHRAERQKKMADKQEAAKVKRAEKNSKYSGILTPEQMEKLNEAPAQNQRNRANFQGRKGSQKGKFQGKNNQRGDFQKKGDFKGQKDGIKKGKTEKEG